jgi:hypothetical protein
MHALERVVCVCEVSACLAWLHALWTLGISCVVVASGLLLQWLRLGIPRFSFVPDPVMDHYTAGLTLSFSCAFIYSMLRCICRAMQWLLALVWLLLRSLTRSANG